MIYIMLIVRFYTQMRGFYLLKTLEFINIFQNKPTPTTQQSQKQSLMYLKQMRLSDLESKTTSLFITFQSLLFVI